MTKIKNKRLHLSIYDVVFSVLLLVLLLVAGLLFNQYSKIKAQYNISKTDVDFIISAPNAEQVSSMMELDHVESVVPYIYRSVECSNDSKNLKASMYFIEDWDEIDSTVFSDSLLIDDVAFDGERSICISDELASELNLSVGDSVSITVSGSTEEYFVARIYGSDHRNVGGTIIALLSESTTNYSGAYVCSRNTADTRAYLDSYVPLGDLRDRYEFDSDEAYQIYLEDRESADYSNSLFDTEAYLKEVSKRYDSQKSRMLVISTVVYLVAAVIPAVCMLIKSRRYTKKDVRKDVRNNFSLDVEKAMYKSYFSSVMSFCVILSLVAFAITFVFFSKFILLIRAICVVVIVFALSVIVSTSVKTCLENEFAKQVKILESERKN